MCLPHQKYSWKLIYTEGHSAQHGGSQASPSGCKKDSESCCTEISPSPVQMVRLASQAQEPGKSPCSQCCISCLTPSESKSATCHPEWVHAACAVAILSSGHHHLRAVVIAF